MATDQTPITLSKILSQTWRVIAAHPRHFSALSALFLLPISVSAVLFYPFFISRLPPSFQSLFTTSTPPPDSNSGQLLASLLYNLSTLPFSLCATVSITYSTFDSYHNKPVKLLPSLQSVPASFLPLLATRFLTLAIFCLATVAFAGLAMLAGLVAYYELKIDTDHRTRYFLIFFVLIGALFMMGLIYLQMKWCLSSAVVVLESKWGYASLKRSSYLVQGTKRVALRLFSLFVSIGSVLGMWYFNAMASRSKGWFCVEMVVYVVFATLLSLYGTVANTVLFINCKASRGEMEVVVLIDEEIGGGGEYVELLKA